MRVFGIDPGSQRTGYGCVDSDGRRHRLVGYLRKHFPHTLRNYDQDVYMIRLDLLPSSAYPAIENTLNK